MRASRAALAVLVAGVVAYAAVSALGGERPAAPEPAFHATLADAALYGGDGIYEEAVEAVAGEYELRFVPNGDSPAMLGVSIAGNATSFEETFELLGTRQGSETATYYTWEYLGEKDVRVGADTRLEVSIDPYGNLNGPVSVTLVPK